VDSRSLRRNRSAIHCFTAQPSGLLQLQLKNRVVLESSCSISGRFLVHIGAPVALPDLAAGHQGGIGPDKNQPHDALWDSKSYRFRATAPHQRATFRLPHRNINIYSHMDTLWPLA
jgi:hypothetical protein